MASPSPVRKSRKIPPPVSKLHREYELPDPPQFGMDAQMKDQWYRMGVRDLLKRSNSLPEPKKRPQSAQVLKSLMLKDAKGERVPPSAELHTAELHNMWHKQVGIFIAQDDFLSECCLGF
jgi:hypothetical protein